MPTEHRYYLCEFCGKNFGNDYESCRKHENEHQENKIFKVIMKKDASETETEIIALACSFTRLFDFVYQDSINFYIYVKSKGEIKAAFDKLKEEVAKYYNVILERDKKTLAAVSANLEKLEVNDDDSTMKTSYYR